MQSGVRPVTHEDFNHYRVRELNEEIKAYLAAGGKL